MTTIHLHRPGSFSHSVPFPTTWNECTTDELLTICRRLIMPTAPEDSHLPMTQTLIELLQSRTRHLRMPRHWLSLIDISDFGIAQAELLPFISQGTTLTRQPFPLLKARWWGLFPFTLGMGPADDFNDLYVGEYEEADLFSNLFAQTQEVKYLVLLAATLYRPSRVWNAQYKADKHDKPFWKLAPEALMLIYTWFKGCQNKLPALFPDLMEKPAGQQKSAPDLAVFTKCIHAAAGPKNGKRSEVRALPLKEFLFDMNLDAKAYKEQMRQFEAAKTK